MYQIESNGMIRRKSDGCYIPPSEGNSDYAAYIAWTRDGNQPEVRGSSQEDIELAVRAERDRKLSACDWSQLADIAPEVRDLWAAYRQALRDIPSQDGFPNRIEWPALPSTDQ